MTIPLTLNNSLIFSTILISASRHCSRHWEQSRRQKGYNPCPWVDYILVGLEVGQCGGGRKYPSKWTNKVILNYKEAMGKNDKIERDTRKQYKLVREGPWGSDLWAETEMMQKRQWCAQKPSFSPISIICTKEYFRWSTRPYSLQLIGTQKICLIEKCHIYNKIQL